MAAIAPSASPGTSSRTGIRWQQLRENVLEATAAYFFDGPRPDRIRLHLVRGYLATCGVRSWLSPCAGAGDTPKSIRLAATSCWRLPSPVINGSRFQTTGRSASER